MVPRAHRCSVLLLSVLSAATIGCASGSDADAGAMDASASDAGSVDAGPNDAGPIDSGASDSGPVDAGSPDAGPADAGTDAGAADAGTDAGPPVGTPVSYLCVPAVSGNETNSGIALSENFWSGFRFEVPAGADVTATSMQVNLRSGGSGTVFGALVRLTGPSDGPDAPDLTGSDVLGTTLIAVPGGPSSTTVSAPITAVLSPGWYAAIFGTGAFGATLSTATIHSNSGGGGCGSGYGYPITIRQSDGMLILQGATPHFQVDGVRP